MKNGLIRAILALASWMFSGAVCAEDVPFGAAPLGITADPVDVMMDGLHRFADRKTVEATEDAEAKWPTRVPADEYRRSIQSRIERFKEITGWIEPDDAHRSLEILAASAGSAAIFEDAAVKIFAVRWSVVDGLDGEGLLIIPSGKVLGCCVAIPDADQTPEMLAGLQVSDISCHPFALEFAQRGLAVIVPALINRRDDFSGNGRIGKWTNQPHREFIYRMAFEMGEHIIGMECAKAAAALRWLEKEYGDVPLGLAGYGEGGLIAFYTAAIEERVDATLVSGYFSPRRNVWREPIYRNVWSLLSDFGEAEITWMIAPRGLMIEESIHPKVGGPPSPRDGRYGAAPGALEQPASEEVGREFARAKKGYTYSGEFQRIDLMGKGDGPAGSPQAILSFLGWLGVPADARLPQPAQMTAARLPDDPSRQKRQFEQMVAYVQRALRYSAITRKDYVRSIAADSDKAGVADWESATKSLREAFYKDVIGRFDEKLLPPNAHMRRKEDAAGYRVWEVMLDVLPDMPAYGWLLEPKNMAAGERRPVVVCQHGLEGRPADTLDAGSHYYHGFARTIAEKGYIVFSPQNPYIGEDRFRSLQRKLNPIGKSLFSVITLQHTQIINWLQSLPMVDPARIGFYGLSYGGKTAMRVPALEPRYCLSICSADFNDWIVKNATYESPYSYLFSGEYEIFEWNLGTTFNYAEMASLIAPRPFMVERGHHDGVAPDEWVAAEFAKVRELYVRLGIQERAEIEFFDGPHEIHGVGTIDFLGRHLGR